MELKSLKCRSVLSATICFNRTFMELKYLIHHLGLAQSMF